MKTKTRKNLAAIARIFSCRVKFLVFAGLICGFSTMVLADHPLPVYHPPRSYPAPVYRYATPYSVTPESSERSFFSVPDYTQRKPFEETDVSMLSPTTKPMRAPMEDDPPFPGDPGDLPVGDGLGLLLLAAAGYAFYKTKKSKISKI
ncbi:MAG: hypothetical protein GX429_09020 [Bacteroidales bacterium]|nr:hypothetical protein [Bacteroidales bacterium]